jgi:hypothetical protein
MLKKYDIDSTPLIDCNGPVDVDDLIKRGLPDLLRQLNQAISKHPVPVAKFAKPNVGPATLFKDLRIGERLDFAAGKRWSSEPQKKHVFPGCYVFIEDSTPIYVGISRNVLNRIGNHVKGKTQLSASFAYRIAADQQQDPGGLATVAMKDKDSALYRLFEEMKRRITEMNVAFIPVDIESDCGISLYMFEPYAAAKLGTLKWNKFTTH